VRDHGNGLSDGVLNFLNDADSIGAGTVGIGLIFVKLTVARAGGTLYAGNLEPDGGAWIELDLPATFECAEAAADPEGQLS
jgi:K+-sensing histidine kinase KdpD